MFTTMLRNTSWQHLVDIHEIWKGVVQVEGGHYIKRTQAWGDSWHENGTDLVWLIIGITLGSTY